MSKTAICFARGSSFLQASIPFKLIGLWSGASGQRALISFRTFASIFVAFWYFSPPCTTL